MWRQHAGFINPVRKKRASETHRVDRLAPLDKSESLLLFFYTYIFYAVQSFVKLYK